MSTPRCMRCMHPLAQGENVCPVCGSPRAVGEQPSFVLAPGTILHGKYLVGLKLGQGGFGITYVGQDLILDRKVAIKEYYPISTGAVTRDATNPSRVVWSQSEFNTAGRKQGCDSFLKEARKMAALDSIPGVVGVRDMFYENDTAYIVMNFIEGETLKDVLKRSGTMSYHYALQVLAPMMEALSKVHAHNIIHRDISPDNIMLCADGSVWLLDLGAAKELELHRSNAPHSSQMVAKQGFSPVEQYMDSVAIGTWTDVYAMSATLYYCVTGKLPPMATDRLFTDKLSCLPPLTQPQFEVLRAGMAVRPDNRIPNMEQLLSRLRAADTVAPQKLTPPTLQTPPVKTPPVKTPPVKTPPVKTPPVKTPPVMTPPTNLKTPPVPKTPPIGQKAGLSRTAKILLSTLIPAAVALCLVILGIQLCWFGHSASGATCTAPSVCNRCGEVLAQPLGHTRVEATCENAAFCTRCSVTFEAALGHDWQDPTCTSPSTCSRCSSVAGSALGHDWAPATCTSPTVCRVCKTMEGSALGHDWIEASYEEAKHCSRCSRHEGDPKGYYSTLRWNWADEAESLSGTSGYAMVFNNPVNKCRSFEFYFRITEVVSGTPFGSWKLYAKGLDGKWTQIGSLQAKDTSGITISLSFDTPISFTALFLAGPQTSSWEARWEVRVSEFRLLED